VSDARVLSVAVPGLTAAVRSVVGRSESPRLPAAEWLAARARRGSADAPDWREWLLDGAGLGAGVLRRFPAGPCARAGRVGSPPTGTWALAEPVHLLTALDHLQLAAPVPLPLEPEESAALLESMNSHLAGSGYRLMAREQGGWLCECPAGLDCATLEPCQAVGRNLREVLPTGRDARRVQALVNELQMLLHEHPVNVRREARGEPTVNSIWLWGVGGVGTVQARTQGMLYTDDDWLTGLWCLHDGCVHPVDRWPGAFDAAPGGVRVALAQDAAAGGADELLRRIESTILAPARAALVSGRIDRIRLHAGGAAFEISAGARWAFWRRARSLAEALA